MAHNHDMYHREAPTCEYSSELIIDQSSVIDTLYPSRHNGSQRHSVSGTASAFGLNSDRLDGFDSISLQIVIRRGPNYAL